MPTISELPALAALSKLDMFEVTKKSDLTSYSVTAGDIANYLKTQSNSGFRGSTTKSIDDFTVEDVGVWHWNNNSSNPTGLTEGIVEIISFNPPDDDNLEASFLQKLSFGNAVFQRMKNNGTWMNWGSLTNRNGATIEYGVSTDTHITFPQGRFASTPAIVCCPINGATGTTVCCINVFNESAGGFSVQKMKSGLVMETETITVEETTAGEVTTKTTTTRTVRGPWEAYDGMPFFYIALSDVGG